MDWLNPWGPVDGNGAAALERELSRELKLSHPLYGKPVRAIGRRDDSDDVLFALGDGSTRVAVVHLTWTGSREHPPWPQWETYLSLDDWVQLRMLPDGADAPGRDG